MNSGNKQKYLRKNTIASAREEWAEAQSTYDQQ